MPFVLLPNGGARVIGTNGMCAAQPKHPLLPTLACCASRLVGGLREARAVSLARRFRGLPFLALDGRFSDGAFEARCQYSIRVRSCVLSLSRSE